MLHEPIGLSVTWVDEVNPVGDWRKGLLACAAMTLLATNLPLSKALPADLPRDAIAAAIVDPSRPATDTVRDANRKPAETLAFAGIKPDDKIADYAAGAGYFTRLFADVAGPKGHVYASVPSALFQYPNIVKGIAELQTYAVAHPNVTVTFASALGAATYPEKLDVFWISQNYHDLHDSFMGPVDMAAFNRVIKLMSEVGAIPSPAPDAERFVDLQYAKAAGIQ